MAMKTIFALLLSLTVPLTAANHVALKPHSSRALVDMRFVVGVVPDATGIDVYWERTNELETPVRSVLMRTTVSTNGTSRLSRVLIHQFEEGAFPGRVDGQGANVQAVWTSSSGGIMASPIVNGALKYPEGKLVTPFGSFPDIACHATECAVIHSFAGAQTATILDADSNVAGSFTLPAGFHPQHVSFSEQGLFFVRHQLQQVRAALVRRDGSVQYDVDVADADPAAFHAGPLAVAQNGAQHAVAFIDYAPEPDEVHAVTISADGTMSEPVRLFQSERHPDMPGNVSFLSLAWNGTSYVLGGGHVIGTSFLQRFDSAFHPLDAEPLRGPAVPWPSAHADGHSFVIVWSAPRPYLTLLTPDGEMTQRLEIDPAPRRRAVR